MPWRSKNVEFDGYWVSIRHSNTRPTHFDKIDFGDFLFIQSAAILAAILIFFRTKFVYIKQLSFQAFQKCIVW